MAALHCSLRGSMAPELVAWLDVIDRRLAVVTDYTERVRLDARLAAPLVPPVSAIQVATEDATAAVAQMRALLESLQDASQREQ